MYDGARVQPEDTPQTLGMDDGDAIDVVIEVRAGMQLADLARSRNGHQLIRRSKSAGGGHYRGDEPARGAGASLPPTQHAHALQRPSIDLSCFARRRFRCPPYRCIVFSEVLCDDR